MARTVLEPCIEVLERLAALLKVFMDLEQYTPELESGRRVPLHRGRLAGNVTLRRGFFAKVLHASEGVQFSRVRCFPPYLVFLTLAVSLISLSYATR